MKCKLKNRYSRDGFPALLGSVALAALGFACSLTAVAADADGGVQAIVRVNFISADVKRLKTFYEKAFDFKVTFEGVVGGETLHEKIAQQWNLPKGSDIYTVLLSAPDGITTLGITGSVGEPLHVLARIPHGPPQGGDHYMILRVHNLTALVAKLRAMGVEFWRPLMQVTGGQEAGIFDPDGTRLIIEEGAA